MRGDPVIIELLNEALSAELTAVNQYLVHGRMCENWGFRRLAARYREESQEEMGDAERLIDRILFLGGTPGMQPLDAVQLGRNVADQFALDLDLERGAVERYARGVRLARENGDGGTRALLEGLLIDEEAHAHWIEVQLHVISQIGAERYLQMQLYE